MTKQFKFLAPLPSADIRKRMLNAITEARPKEIQGLWFKQPFASLMLQGKVETRTWHTRYRGLVLICASSSNYSWPELQKIADLEAMVKEGVLEDIGTTRPAITPLYRIRGHAIAIGRLADSRPLLKEDRSFVQYVPELFAHVYEDVCPILPFPLKGRLGWNELGWDEIRKIELLEPKHLL